jgi:hypothetical protein
MMDSSYEWRLKRFEQEGVDLMNRIVTVDETWISLYTHETKAQTSIWKALGSQSPKRFKLGQSAMKNYHCGTHFDDVSQLSTAVQVAVRNMQPETFFNAL